MAKAMPALAEDRQRRLKAEPPQMDGAPQARPESAAFLAVKNGLFWGSAALMCALIYAIAASIF